MSRRKPFPPDTRPKSTDPDLPVLVHMADTNQLEPFKPKEMEKVAAYRLSHSEELDWRNDPTYDLRKKK